MAMPDRPLAFPSLNLALLPLVQGEERVSQTKSNLKLYGERHHWDVDVVNAGEPISGINSLHKTSFNFPIIKATPNAEATQGTDESRLNFREKIITEVLGISADRIVLVLQEDHDKESTDFLLDTIKKENNLIVMWTGFIKQKPSFTVWVVMPEESAYQEAARNSA